MIFGALIGAIIWNIITWRLGIPSSSSHALIGGLVGAGIAKAGVYAVVWDGVVKTIAGDLPVARLIGCLLALLLMLLVSWLFVRYTPYAVDHIFRRVQFVSASLYSLGHGGNDAQKTMGIIAVLLYSQGYLGGEFYVPFWVVLACQAAMALGTLVGGWRIVRTMGSQHHAADADAGLLRRDRRLDHAVRARPGSAFRSRPRTPSPAAIIGVGARQEGVGGALERGQRHRHRLDHHHPGGGALAALFLLAERAVGLI